MKKYFAFLFIVVMTMMAHAEVMANFNFYDQGRYMGFTVPRDGESIDLPTLTIDGVTISSTGNVVVFNDDSDLELRFMAGGEVTFTCDYPFTKIEAEGQSMPSATFLTANCGEYSADGSSYTGIWTPGDGSFKSVTFTATALTKMDGFIVYYDEPTTGVGGINTDAAVKSVKYVNAMGQVSNVPFQGVNIVVTEMTDGSIHTTKVLK